MKTLIVQGITSRDMHPNEIQTVYIPLMQTVKQWAERRGYDYHAYSNPKAIIDFGEQLGISLSTEATNQFYKFQWMHNHYKYDRIVWVDADIWVWGDPDPLGDEWFCCPIIFREHQPTWMKHEGFPWRRPNFGMFWGSSEGIYDFCTTAFKRIEDKTQRGDCTNYLLIHHRNFDHSRRESAKINDEWFMAEWLHDNQHRVRQIRCEAGWDYGTGECDWYVNWPNIPTTDSFIHLSGPKKYQKFQQLQLFFEMRKKGLPVKTFLEP